LELQNKGLNNSREELWMARLSEFEASPIFGVGVGMGMVSDRVSDWDGVVVDASGKVNIEPGSSYLAVLSMTGLFGAIGVLLLLFSVFKKLRRRRTNDHVDSDLFEYLAISGFFVIHMVAEGYIFSEGHQLCLLLWLCLGCLFDIASLSKGRRKHSRPVSFNRLSAEKCFK
jgi:O-antigen ligase